MNTILIVDDDIGIGNMEQTVLEKAGYCVLRAYSGTEALLILKNEKPSLILLDLMLPGLTGEEVLPSIKGIPVIVVSAKADVNDKVSLLLGGAADYLTKPFDTKELLARIEVQLRKAQNGGLSDIYTFDDITLDTVSFSVTVKDTPISLTKTEFAILKLLIANPNQVIARSVILDRISLDTPDCTERSLRQHISNLRGKLSAVSGKDYIEAVWGIGFKLKS